MNLSLMLSTNLFSFLVLEFSNLRIKIKSHFLFGDVIARDFDRRLRSFNSANKSESINTGRVLKTVQAN